MTEALAGKTILMSGGSRGIGLAIALRAAADGANIALLAKTDSPHPKLEGTVHSAAEQIRAAGGNALPIVGDVRNDDDITEAVLKTQGEFGGIDIVVNNASVIDLSRSLDLAAKKYDLMQDVNVRGTFMLVAGGRADPEGCREPAHPVAVAAAEPRPEVARRPHRLHAREVRHDDGDARLRRGVREGRDRRQHAVAAHDDRDRGGAEPARRRHGDGREPHARDLRRRRVRGAHAPVAGVHGTDA